MNFEVPTPKHRTCCDCKAPGSQRVKTGCQIGAQMAPAYEHVTNNYPNYSGSITRQVKNWTPCFDNFLDSKIAPVLFLLRFTWSYTLQNNTATDYFNLPIAFLRGAHAVGTCCSTWGSNFSFNRETAYRFSLQESSPKCFFDSVRHEDCIFSSIMRLRIDCSDIVFAAGALPDVFLHLFSKYS